MNIELNFNPTRVELTPFARGTNYKMQKQSANINPSTRHYMSLNNNDQVKDISRLLVWLPVFVQGGMINANFFLFSSSLSTGR